MVSVLGASLLVRGGTLLGLLQNNYPEHEWLPWRFTFAPSNYWDDVKNHKTFIEHAAKSLGVSKMEDWYSISRRKLLSLGGSNLF
jgi:hypothetical protein